MGCVIAAVVILVAVSWVTAVIRHLHAQRFNAAWWVAFGVSVILGVRTGAWVGTQLEYPINARTRVVGFPLPLAVFVLEGEHWTDFVPPDHVQHALVAANVLSVMALALIPLAVAARVAGRAWGIHSATGSVGSRRA